MSSTRTYVMFNREQFILEIRDRSCLWDSRDKSFNDRTAKKTAWEEIAKIMFPGWEEDSEEAKKLSVEELQKKWKHLRDYHVKERGNTPRKRKQSYIDLLNFLDVVVKEPQKADNVMQTAECTSDENTNEPNSPLPESSIYTQVLGSQSKSGNRHETQEEDSDTKFLLSLLPQMRSLNEKQNFEFRMEVMNSLYRIKYRKVQFGQNQVFQTGGTEMPNKELIEASEVQSIKQEDPIFVNTD